MYDLPIYLTFNKRIVVWALTASKIICVFQQLNFVYFQRSSIAGYLMSSLPLWRRTAGDSFPRRQATSIYLKSKHQMLAAIFVWWKTQRQMLEYLVLQHHSLCVMMVSCIAWIKIVQPPQMWKIKMHYCLSKYLNLMQIFLITKFRNSTVLVWDYAYIMIKILE